MDEDEADKTPLNYAESAEMIKLTTSPGAKELWSLGEMAATSYRNSAWVLIILAIHLLFWLTTKTKCQPPKESINT